MGADPTPHGASGRAVDPEGKVVARHRSPQGRRLHLGLPLPLVAVAAGAGGGRAHAATPGVPLVPRMIATVLAGSALAAAGQAALGRSLPGADDGAAVLATGAQELLTGSAAAPPAASVVVPSSPAAPDVAPPQPVDVSALVKSAELQRAAAERAAAAQAARDRAEAAAQATARAEAAARAKAAEAARRPAPAAPRPRSPRVAVPGGAVQMVTGVVTSGFGARWGRAHRGLDIAAPIGTPIHAPLAGEVIAAGPASGFGLWVRLRHTDGTVTTYGHVNRALVRVGQQVTAGQVIAEVGNRGESTGPHLHVEVQTPGGATVNPRPWLDDHRIGY